MMKRLASLLLAGAILVTGCGGAKSDSGKSGGLVNVTIASMSPLSGASATQGESIRYGAELAIKDRAAELEKAGYKVSFLAMDDQDKPEQGTQLAEQLLTKKDVVGVVATLSSGVVIPVSQKLAGDSLVIVSPANTATQVTDRGLPNMNRIVARDDAQGPAAAQYIKDKLHASSLFIIHDKTPYGQGVAEEVKKTATAAGLKVDAFEGINKGEKDYSAVLSKAKSVGSPVIYFGGQYSEMSQILKQAKEKGVTAQFMGADGIDSAELVRLAGDAANGVLFTSVVSDISKTPEGQDFAKRYQALAKKEMDSYSAYAYDCALIILKALEDFGKAHPGTAPTRKELAEAVRKTAGFKGIAGTHTFDGKGDDKEAKVFIYQFQGGKYPATLIQ